MIRWWAVRGAIPSCWAYGPGVDTIADFEVGLDKLQLIGGLSPDQLTLSASGSDTLIRYQGRTLAILQNVQPSSLDFGRLFDPTGNPAAT
jgi:hypothetical protein